MAELRELEKAATPGPWRCHPYGATLSASCGLDSPGSTHADAALIVAMRNALPALLDVVEAARAFVDFCGDDSFEIAPQRLLDKLSDQTMPRLWDLWLEFRAATTALDGAERG